MSGKDVFYSTSCLTKIAISPKYPRSVHIRTFIDILNLGGNNQKKLYKEKKLIG